MVWTRFMDMHSGGGLKEPPYAYIHIEAPEAEAKVIFYNRFGHNPERVTCTCCGDDYSISEAPDMAQSSAYDRGCLYEYRDPKGKPSTWEAYRKAHTKDGKPGKGWFAGYVEKPNTKYNPKAELQTLAQYLKRKDVLVISKKEIKQAERVGSVPAQGYVWQD